MLLTWAQVRHWQRAWLCEKYVLKLIEGYSYRGKRLAGGSLSPEVIDLVVSPEELASIIIILQVVSPLESADESVCAAHAKTHQVWVLCWKHLGAWLSLLSLGAGGISSSCTALVVPSHVRGCDLCHMLCYLRVDGSCQVLELFNVVPHLLLVQ